MFVQCCPHVAEVTNVDHMCKCTELSCSVKHQHNGKLINKNSKVVDCKKIKLKKLPFTSVALRWRQTSQTSVSQNLDNFKRYHKRLVFFG